MRTRDKDGMPRANITVDAVEPRDSSQRAARPVRVLDGDLARVIDRAEIGTGEVLGLSEEEILSREGVADDRVVVQVDDYLRKDKAQSRRGGEYKVWEAKYPGWVAWRDRLSALRKGERPAALLRDLVATEVRKRLLADLVRDAETYLRGRHLEWSEHEKMLARARQLGLSDEDVESAYVDVARRGGFDLTRSAPPKGYEPSASRPASSTVPASEPASVGG
jgi:hypothetical protein